MGRRSFLSTAAAGMALAATAQVTYQAEEDRGQSDDIPYQRYFTRDALGRRITFYITKPADAALRLPLVVSILGSGADSNFIRRDGRILDGHRALRTVFAGRAHVLIVEKPGVSFCEHPKRTGTSDGASDEFRREYTLDRWAEAVSAAFRASRTLPFIDPARTLVLGHSEGGLVACRVAAMNPSVTHVTSLTGGGPTRLFSMVELARAGYIYGEAGNLPGQREEKLLTEWAMVMRDPDSPSKDFRGHPYRAWTSFVRSSCMEELLRTNARVYIAHGTEDHNSAPLGFEILRAHLLAHGRDVTADRVVGADHGFFFPTEPKRDGQSELFGRVRNWFLAESGRP
jgi:pimeloyl-ACP methyl ester carboxylesterase